MPYMHWETERGRKTVAKMIDDESYKQVLKQEQYDLAAKKARFEQRRDITDGSNRIRHDYADSSGLLKRLLKVKPKNKTLDRSLTDLLPRFTKLPPSEIEVEADGHLRLNNKHPLGQYLIDAARLYEAMSTFRDKQLIEKYLYNNPPLHPRRTLDQSHYWTLKTTKARDKDQVVYRGTAMNLDMCHKFRKVPVQKMAGEKMSILERFKLIFKEHDASEEAPHRQPTQEPAERPRGTASSRFGWWGKTKREADERWQWIGHW